MNHTSHACVKHVLAVRCLLLIHIFALNVLGNVLALVNLVVVVKAMTANVVALGAVAVFEARKCQYTTKADARHNVRLTTEPAIEPNACYQHPFFQSNSNF